MQRGPQSECAALSLSGGSREKGGKNKKREARPPGTWSSTGRDGTGMSDGGGERGRGGTGGGVVLGNSRAASHIHIRFNGKFVVKSPALND